MAVTSEEKEKARKLLEREDEQNRNMILSRLENFGDWLRVFAGIAISAKEIADVFVYVCSFFG